MSKQPSADQKRRYVRALKVARDSIETHTTSFVCDAVTNASSTWIRAALISDRDAAATRRMINHRLEGHGTVIAWLVKHLNAGHRLQTRIHLHKRDYRLLWIDSMIAEFSMK